MGDDAGPMRFLPFLIAGAMVLFGLWIISQAAMGPEGEVATSQDALQAPGQDVGSRFGVGFAILAGGVFLGWLAAKRR